MTPLIREFASEKYADCAWFDLGEMEGFDGPPGRITGMHLPFSDVSIVGKSKGSKFHVVAVELEDDVYWIGGTAIYHDKTPDELPPVVIEVKEDSFLFGPYSNPEEEYADMREIDSSRLEENLESDTGKPTEVQAAMMLAIMAELLLSTNQTGYRCELPRNSITNRRRARKGKPLQYTWRTVTIEPPAPKTERKGGTHASPRQHQRRGHWRITPKGKRVWIRDCTVGDPSKGAVFKDYKLTGCSEK